MAAGEQAPILDLAARGSPDPEVVVVKPCGYPLQRTLAGCLHPDHLGDHRARYHQAVRRVDADLEVHADL